MNAQYTKLPEEQEHSLQQDTQPISSSPSTYPSHQTIIHITGSRGEWQCFAKLMIE